MCNECNTLKKTKININDDLNTFFKTEFRTRGLGGVRDAASVIISQEQTEWRFQVSNLDTISIVSATSTEFSYAIGTLWDTLSFSIPAYHIVCISDYIFSAIKTCLNTLA